MIKIILLGADGFIGRSLIDLFKDEKDFIVEGFSPPEIDLLNHDSIDKKLGSESECIIIMTSGITRLVDNSYESMLKNISMAINISKFIEKNPPSYFIFLSTVDVYGILNSSEIINEKLLTSPQDYYSISKMTSEFIIREICSKNNIPLLILRLSGVYGPKDNGKSTIGTLIESARKGRINIFGDGEDKRDFIFIEDIFQIIKKAVLLKPDITLNLATGESYSINEIVYFLRNYFDFEIKYTLNKEEKRIRNMVYDTSLLKKTFPNFTPTSLKSGIKLYFNQKTKEINLLEKFPKVKRDINERNIEKTEEDKKIAKKFGKEYFDGDRKHGYGGYFYHQRFWEGIVRDMIKYYALNNKSKILDVGCAKGFMLHDFKKALPELELRGIDISEYAIENTIEDMKSFVLVGNAKDLSIFKDKEFNLVISINTIHNLPIEECKQALREIQRVGKNAFISVDAWRNKSEEERMKKWNLTAETFMHVEDWKKLFEEVGYEGDYYWFIL